jgi:hypothetical protein
MGSQEHERICEAFRPVTAEHIVGIWCLQRLAFGGKQWNSFNSLHFS